MNPALVFGLASTALVGLFGLVVLTSGRPQPGGPSWRNGVVPLVALLTAIAAILCAVICFSYMFTPV